MIEDTRKFMRENDVDYLLVNCTNQFLVEYAPLSENSRYALTNFSGSAGDALVSRKNLWLFVDGRYHTQADLEVDHNIVDVVKLQIGDKMIIELCKRIAPDSTLGIFSKKVSQKTLENLKLFFREINVKIKLIENDFFEKSSCEKNSTLISVEEFAGKTVLEKLSEIRTHLENNAILINNLEEVSYMTNLRDFSRDFTTAVQGKLFITEENATLFTDKNVGISLDGIKIEPLTNFEKFIKNLDENLKVLVDKNSINAYDFNLLGERAQDMEKSFVKELKSIKTDKEIEEYKKAFEATDKALSDTRDYIQNTENPTEKSIADFLEKSFHKYGAKSLSFRSIVAKDKNSALAHYSKSSPDEVLKEGSLVLIDCGAYYESGLATDITRVFVKGEPNALQKQVYTTVLKAFLNCFNFKITNTTCGYEIDALAHKILDKNLEGFDFSHGLGHGIGVSVHEAPPNLSTNEIAKVILKDNMCFTIEPGLYNPQHFGVRLENSCYLKNGKIHSFVKMGYQENLIDYKLLTDEETTWLKQLQA